MNAPHAIQFTPEGPQPLVREIAPVRPILSTRSGRCAPLSKRCRA